MLSTFRRVCRCVDHRSSCVTSFVIRSPFSTTSARHSSSDDSGNSDDKISAAAKKAASSVSGNSNSTYNDIMKQLKGLNTRTADKKSSPGVKVTETTPKMKKKQPPVTAPLKTSAQKTNVKPDKKTQPSRKKRVDHMNEVSDAVREFFEDEHQSDMRRKKTQDGNPRRVERPIKGRGEMGRKDRDSDAIHEFFMDEHADRGERKAQNGRPHHVDKSFAAGYLPQDSLLGGIQPVGIFNPKKWPHQPAAEIIPVSDLWVKGHQKTLDNLRYHPINGFDEMIRWTEEGKLWQYPIDNEQGMDEEKNTPFYDHVFLDKYLDEFPESGPVREFIELVTTGLSKNPYITVREKVDHIQWFAEYFRSKQALVPHDELLAKSE